MEDINQAVVNAGHQVLGREEEMLKGRCDSFVVETDVAYPTDINLPNTAIRKVIELCGKASQEYDLLDWRQFKHHLAGIKNLHRTAQQTMRYNPKDEEKKAAHKEKIDNAHQFFMDRSLFFLEIALTTLDLLAAIPGLEALCDELEY